MKLGLKPALMAVVQLLLSVCHVTAQTAPNPNRNILPQFIPRSPEAAVFEKYGDIPVSLSNGTVNLSIPLYTIKTGSIEIPVSLSYNYNGAKANEIPSYAGMGWSISAGGAINYEQRGLNDYKNDAEGAGLMALGSYYNSLDSLKKWRRGGMTPQQANLYMEKLTDRVMDGEFDYYHFSFPGTSGGFYRDTNRQIVVVPKTGIKVRSFLDENSYIITDLKGTEWSFNTLDVTAGVEEVDPFDWLRPGFSGGASIFLSGIKSTDNRWVNFQYGSVPFFYTTTSKSAHIMSARPYTVCPASRFVTSRPKTSLTNSLLTKIEWDGGKIEFELSTEAREDIKSFALATPSVPFLKKIKIYNAGNKLITEYTLHHSNSSSRLRLDSLTRTDIAGNPAVWKFDYEGNPPGLMGKSTDHWGYVNDGPEGFAKANYESIAPGWGPGLNIYVGNKESSNAGKAGLIKKISYPTGGSSTFEYESNAITFTDPSQLATKTFLSTPFATTPSQLVNTDTHLQDEVSGSFTLTETSNVYIEAYRWYQPTQFINSVITLTKSPSSTNIIDGSSYTCTATACESNNWYTLQPGTYNYTLKKYFDEFYLDGFASLKVTKHVPLPTSRYQVGGFRIKTVKHYDSLGNSTMKRYEYADRVDSLGYINYPNYVTKSTINAVLLPGACAGCGLKSIISEESIAPMSGNPVEYLYVTEYSDENGANGKTTWEFTPNENRFPGAGPYLTPFKVNWRAGLPKTKKHFKWNGTGYELIQLDSTGYQFNTVNEGITTGIKTEYSTYCDISGYGFRTYSYQTPQFSTELFQNKSQSQVYYDGTGKITTATENIYGSTKHTLPTETQTTGSDGAMIKEKIKYSFDYDTTTITGNEAKGIRLLQRLNMVVPIEKVSVKNINGVDHVLSATLFTYKADTAVLDKVFNLLTDAPIAYTGYTNSTITAGQLIKDCRFDETARFTRYDANLNPLQMQYTNNIIKSYIWDHNNQYPVCEVNGAALTDIAYTSFETGNNGSWTITAGSTLDSTYFLTGRRCLQTGTATISKSGLSTGKQFTLSYWSRSGTKTITGATGTSKTGIVANGWTYYEHFLTTTATTISVSGTGYIDELRLYPAAAQMSSITFDPLIGISSQCDVRNNVAYYEYDQQNRLMHIRDIKRNILKKFEYQYQQYATPQPVWTATGVTRCKPCAENPAYQSSTQQREEKDNNTQSISYNQTRWVDLGSGGSCTDIGVWQNTATAIRCKKNGSNQNTGEQEREQKDINPCSPTYNQFRWIVTGTNTTACPIPPSCTMNVNCFGPSQKCINNICETGIKVYTGNYGYDPGTGMYKCYFNYEFSDGSRSTLQFDWSETMCEL